MTIKKVFPILSLIAFLFFGGVVLGQRFSSEGKSFYVSVVPNYNTSPDVEITLSSSKKAIVNLVNSNTGFSTTINLLPNAPQSVTVPANACIPSTNDVVGTDVVNITSDEPISVYVINSAPASSDGILAYPEDGYGSEYYVASYQGLGANFNSNFIIVATENNTIVDITPSENTLGGHTKGVKYQVVLDKGES